MSHGCLTRTRFPEHTGPPGCRVTDGVCSTGTGQVGRGIKVRGGGLAQLVLCCERAGSEDGEGLGRGRPVGRGAAHPVLAGDPKARGMGTEWVRSVGPRVRLPAPWSRAAGTERMPSAVNAPVPGWPRALLFQGLQPSPSRGGGRLTMRICGNSPSSRGLAVGWSRCGQATLG